MDPRKHLTEDEYNAAFSSSTAHQGGDKSKREKALEHALDIRKFEIEMYWKRATYFWTFIAAALAGFGALQGAKDMIHREELSTVVGVLGFVFSLSWYCVNRGSKQWMENWENHVDMLEDEVVGPLYKTVNARPEAQGKRQQIKRFLTGPFPFSVTKINQIVSLFVTILWIFLVYLGIGPLDRVGIIGVKSGAVALGVTASLLIWTLGRTDQKNYAFTARQRSSSII